MNELKYSWQSEQTEQKKCDRVLILVLAIIIVTGLVILYSTSAYNGEIKFQDTFYYLKKQVFATLLGIMGMWCIANIDYHIWKKWAVPGYLLSILLGVLVMLFGEEYNGSKRWLSLGPISFQPSEFAKVAVILFLTYIILRNAEKMWKFSTVLQDCYQCVANCRSGWGKQFEHSGYYSGNSSHPGICRKSEVWAICVDGVSGVCIYGDISCYGKLPA